MRRTIHAVKEEVEHPQRSQRAGALSRRFCEPMAFFHGCTDCRSVFRSSNSSMGLCR